MSLIWKCRQQNISCFAQIPVCLHVLCLSLMLRFGCLYCLVYFVFISLLYSTSVFIFDKQYVCGRLGPESDLFRRKPNLVHRTTGLRASRNYIVQRGAKRFMSAPLPMLHIDKVRKIFSYTCIQFSQLGHMITPSSCLEITYKTNHIVLV